MSLDNNTNTNKIVDGNQKVDLQQPGIVISSNTQVSSNNSNKGDNDNMNNFMTMMTTTTSGRIHSSKDDGNNSANRSSINKDNNNKNDTSTSLNDNSKYDNKELKNKTKEEEEPSLSVVMEYLQKRGLTSAVLELSQLTSKNTAHQKQDINEKNNDSKKRGSSPSSSSQEEKDDDFDQMEAKTRNQRSSLTLSSGGGLGQDLDAAPAILMWGSNNNNNNYNNNLTATADEDLGNEESQKYTSSFASLFQWVLSLPTNTTRTTLPLFSSSSSSSNNINDPSTNKTATTEGETDEEEDNEVDDNEEEKTSSSSSSLQESPKKKKQKQTHHPQTKKTTSVNNDNGNTAPDKFLDSKTLFQRGGIGGVKSELLSLCFPLFIHSYCEIMECSANSKNNDNNDSATTMKAEDGTSTKNNRKESTDCIYAKKFLNTYRSLYELSYGKELEELETYSNTLEEYQHHLSQTTTSNSGCSQHSPYKRKEQWTFLQRVRSLRWQIYISEDTFRILSNQLSTHMVTLGTMNALLQSRCHINIFHKNNNNSLLSSSIVKPSSLFFHDAKQQYENNNIRWATPSSYSAHTIHPDDENKEDTGSIKRNIYDELPYPKFYLDYEYESKELAQKDKANVKFNRMLVMNGFRRLQALEAVAHHQVKRRHHCNNNSNNMNNNDMTDPKQQQQRVNANPLEPTILLQTLSSSSSINNNNNNNNSGEIARVSSVGIMTACLAPPDGRRVAVACDDASISIYNSVSSNGIGTNSAQVLLGHFHGLPVYDIHWNPNGRHLLSCGGDGTIRLWDTMAVGPHGKLATTTSTAKNSNKSSKHSKSNNNMNQSLLDSKKKVLDQSLVPHTVGNNNKPMVQVQGAMLACYKSSPTPCPILSVEFAPCGYYFASSDGQTGMAKIWVTDRPTPVRILVGHLAGSIHKVKWHPNCNYLFTSSDDQTIRMWDVQTGKCVRLFFTPPPTTTTTTDMVVTHTCLAVSPNGQYLAGANQNGKITIWNVADSSIHCQMQHNNNDNDGTNNSMIYSMVYSSCGTVLASAGEDGTVRIWNISATTSTMDDEEQQQPVLEKEFATKHTMLLHLMYTKRDLLLSVGKYAGPSSLLTSSNQ